MISSRTPDSLGQPKLARIRQRRRLGDEVAQQVRDAIMSGTYVAGEKLVVEDLASQLGVSTMPVREALVALAHEGVLQVSPRRGFGVARLGKQDIEDIFRVQAFLAGILAERASQTIDEKGLRRLQRIQEKVERAAANGDTGASSAQIEDLNYEFHYSLNHVVDAPRLRWFLRVATQYVPRHVYETIPTWTRLTVVDHPQIIEALESRDPTAARRRAETHVMRAGMQVVENLEARGFWV